MKVIANIGTPYPTKQPLYGDLIGKVISSGDLYQGSKSAYLICHHPTLLDSVLMVPLEDARTATPALRTTALGGGYVVRHDATIILEGIKS